MADMVVRCTRCGQIDDRQQFGSDDDAQAALGSWACSRCGWIEWDLVNPPTRTETPVEVGSKQG